VNILITGASGLIGSALVEYFVNKGHSIFSLQRNKKPDSNSFWNFDRLNGHGVCLDFDAVVHLAGENIANGRWTRRKKKLILQSRVHGTKELAEYCSKLHHKPEVFISASAIGYYGDRGDTVVDETSSTGTNFVAEVCREWERAAKPAEKAGIRVVNARIGMVLSGKGGTLSTMLPSFKLGIAGIVGNGKQYVSWIDIRDVISIIHETITDRTISGPINLVSPHPVTNYEFTKTLGRIVQKPTVMRMPAFVAKTVFGRMGVELVLSSTRVLPKLLLDKNYLFQAPDLGKSLRDCLQLQE
jgi:uncharacterized protein (TIGR01777 family)